VPHHPADPNVLAVRFSSIGDVLLTTPLLRAIRRRHPGARITVLTKQAYAPLLSHNPHLDQVLGVSPERTLTKLARELRAARFTHLLDLHKSLQSRAVRALVPGRWATYPKHRVARAVLIHTKRNLYRDARPVPERYFAAARGLDVIPDGEPPDLFLADGTEPEIAEWLMRAGMMPEQQLVALAPGTAHATKRWPLEHWRSLVNQLLKKDLGIVVVGGPEDAALGASLTEVAGGRTLNAAGRFGLQHTGALLQRASAVVSGDTGVMHMATAVRTPAVALFGPTVRHFGFFPYTGRAEVIELGLSCRPCSSKGGPECPLGHHRCMRDITPSQVYQAVTRSLR
jgi:lipopolysaccharide heptosyltransferase II